MRRQTATLSIVASLADAILAAWLARPAAALIVDPMIRLLTSNIAIARGTLWAALTEATFDGYAAVALTTHGPLNTPNNGRALVGDADFVAGAMIADPGELIHGVALTGTVAGATFLFAGELFDAPIAFATPGDSLLLDIYLPQPLMIETGLEQ